MDNYRQRQSGDEAIPTHWFYAGEVASTWLSVSGPEAALLGLAPSLEPATDNDTAAVYDRSQDVYYFLDPTDEN